MASLFALHLGPPTQPAQQLFPPCTQRDLQLSPSRVKAKTLAEWSKYDVREFLRSLQLEMYTDLFIVGGIYGNKLYNVEKKDLLRLGITKIGHIKRILRALALAQIPPTSRTNSAEEEVVREEEEEAEDDSGNESARSSSPREGPTTPFPTPRAKDLSVNYYLYLFPSFMLRVKCIYGDDITIIRLPYDSISFLSLNKKIKKIHGNKPLEIRYKDSEGDYVKISNNSELNYACRDWQKHFSEKKKMLRLILSDQKKVRTPRG